MAGITLEKAQSMLDDWIEAERKHMSGQSYTIGGKSVTKASLSDIRQSIQYWAKVVKQLKRKKKGKGSARISRVVLMD